MSQDPSQQPDPDFQAQEQEPVQPDAESTSESTQSTQLTEEKLKQLPAWLRKEMTDVSHAASHISFRQNILLPDAEGRTMAQSPSPSLRESLRSILVPIIPILIGGTFVMILGLVELQGSLPPFFSYTQGQCMITNKSLEYKFNGKKYLYTPVFAFTVQTTDQHMYQANGYTAVPVFSSQEASQAILDAYDYGQTYTCWYDPAIPTHAVLVRDLNLLLFFIGAGLNVFFLCLSVKVNRSINRAKKRA
ncbi:MAG: DUF3592 domain-containing protein [Ktedonobacteraceae bacterium]